MSASLSNDFPQSSLPTVALLAGGLATRLRPVTATIPKSMVSVAGEPFIAHQLRLLSGQNARDVVICGGYLMEQIEAYVGDGAQFGCRVRYCCDGPRLLGTGGAVRRALPLLGAQFFVLYGDSYLTVPFAAVFARFVSSGKAALMTILRNQGRWDASNVEVQSGEIVRYGKSRAEGAMEHIDYGLSLFTPGVFERQPPDTPFGLSEIQTELVEEGAMASFEVEERFYEIGSMRGIDETDRFLRSRGEFAGATSRAVVREGMPA